MKASEAWALSNESGPKRAQEELDQALLNAIDSIKYAANLGEYNTQGSARHANYVKTKLIDLGYAVTTNGHNPNYLFIEWRST